MTNFVYLIVLALITIAAVAANIVVITVTGNVSASFATLFGVYAFLWAILWMADAIVDELKEISRKLQ